MRSEKKRRELAAELVTKINDLRSQVEIVRDELSAYAEDRSERWHDSERAETHEEITNAWLEAENALQDAMDNLDIDQ